MSRALANQWVSMLSDFSCDQSTWANATSRPKKQVCVAARNATTVLIPEIDSGCVWVIPLLKDIDRMRSLPKSWSMNRLRRRPPRLARPSILRRTR